VTSKTLLKCHLLSSQISETINIQSNFLFIKPLYISTTLKQFVKSFHFAFKVNVYMGKTARNIKRMHCVLLLVRQSVNKCCCNSVEHTSCKVCIKFNTPLAVGLLPLPNHVQWLVLNTYIIVRKSHTVKSGNEVSFNKNLTLCLKHKIYRPTHLGLSITLNWFYFFSVSRILQ